MIDQEKTALGTALRNAPAMRMLLENEGWKILKNELDTEMADIVARVMDSSEDPTERDRLIHRYRLLKSVVEKPQRILDASNVVISQEAPKEQLED